MYDSLGKVGPITRFIRGHAAVKIIAGIILILLVFSVIISYTGFRHFSLETMSLYAEGAFLTAETAAEFVDPDKMDAYAASGGTTEEYRAVWSQMDRLCNSSGATFIYVIRPDRTDYGHITFLFSTINHETDYTVYDFGYVRETTNDEYREKYQAIYDLEADRELVIRNRGYIETDPHITAMIGLKGSDGQVEAILCVQRQMDALVKARAAYLRAVLLEVMVLLALVIAAEGLFLSKNLLWPVRKISEEATRFSEENVIRGEKLSDTIRNMDEIGQLAESIDHMEEQIQDYVENLTRITAEKERINTELSLATRIQADMLPNIFPAFPEYPEFEIYASMDPAREVGGDFYDFFLVDEDHLGMVIADVSGKGVPAALFMMASKIILANNAKAGKSPAEILRDTNNSLAANNREEMFVTAWLGILELSTGRLIAANAGHEYPALRREGDGFALVKDQHGFVIGGMEGMQYPEYELLMEPGAKLFVYTDGVPEATNRKKELFGTDRMLDALNADPDGDPDVLLRKVREAVDGFVGEAEQFDDLTMMCLEYRGKGAREGA